MGRVKALLPWPPLHGAQALVTHVVDVLRDAGVGPIGVVTGPHHREIAAALDTRVAVALFNPLHERGQLSSLQHGLTWAVAQGERPWVLTTLVDVPGVRVDTVRQLLEAARGAATLAVRPVMHGRHGHPVLWHRDAVPLVGSADPATGARQVMRALAGNGQVLDVPVDDPAVLRDIDTWDDYEGCR